MSALDLFDHNKLIDIARRINQCLDRKCKSSSRDSEFKSIIETECNADVFPVTKTAAMCCQCELGAMTHGEILSIKLANLDEIHALIAKAKSAMADIKMMEIGTALVGVVPKPSDTQLARTVMKEIEEDMETKVSALKGSVRILNNWFGFLDRFKLEEAPVIREYDSFSGEFDGDAVAKEEDEQEPREAECSGRRANNKRPKVSDDYDCVPKKYGKK
jgi:hypothetical protein